MIALKSVNLAAAPSSPIQPVPKDALLTLAKEEFGEGLSRAEQELFHVAQRGLATPVLVEYHEDSDPANAAKWPPDRVIRAECISWLCTDPRASALVSHSGLQLQGKRIDGVLNLANADIKFPFAAEECAFSHKISLEDAQLRGFYLPECKIMGLRADRAIFKGPLFLRGLKANGEIHLEGAKIGGDLDCAGGHFSNAKGQALNAEAAKVEGSVFLGKYIEAETEFPFKVEGEVSLAGATIGGNLDCAGGQFLKPGGRALNVQGSKIQGRVFLVNGFRAQGKVDLIGARMSVLVIRNVLEAEQTVLDLQLAQAETLWDQQTSWPKTLFLDGFRYERLYKDAPFDAGSRKKWLSLQPRDGFRPQPYEQLAAVLRQMGHERDAREVMIEKNRDRARFTDFPHGDWWWSNLFGRFIGYGYAPWRAFAASLAMILLGTLLFRLGFKHALIGPTSDNAYAKAPDGQVIEENGCPKSSETYPVFNALVYSFESFVPLLKLDQSANWRPNANHGAPIALLPFWSPRAGNLVRAYLYFHIAAGWLLTSLWVGAVTGLVKT